MRFLSIDPGSLVAGWAVFLDGAPVEFGTWRAPKGKPARERIPLLARQAAFTIAEHTPDAVVLEQPGKYLITKNCSQKALIGKALSLSILNLALGTFVGIAIAAGCHTDLVEVNVWKKTMSKASTNLIVRAALGRIPEKVEQDALDAIALGLWYCRERRRAETGLPTVLSDPHPGGHGNARR